MRRQPSELTRVAMVALLTAGAAGCGLEELEDEHGTTPGREPEVSVPSIQQAQQASAYGNYGIAVDGKGRVYVAGYPQEAWTVGRYDPATKTWLGAASTRQAHSGMGRGVTVDANNEVWVAQHGGWSGGRITGYDADTLAVKHDVNIASGGTIPIGIGIGANGVVWTANQGTWNATAYDPKTGNIGFYPRTGNLGSAPYTYSDFTGNLFRTFTAPQGTYSSTVNACGGFPVSAWKKLSWGGITPAGTALKLQLRVATTQAGLAAARWYPDGDNNPVTVEYWQTSPVSLTGIPTAGVTYAEVLVTLVSSSSGAAPTLNSFSLARECPAQPN